MNTLFTSWEQGWQIAGWTMVYFLAIGTLVAIVAGVLRLALRSAAPTVRYVASLAGFAVLALLPLGIAGWLLQAASQQVLQDQLFSMSRLPAFELPVSIEENHPRLAERPTLPTPRASKSEPSLQDLSWSAPQIVAHLPWIWLVGTPLTFLLLASGLIGAERLRRTSQPVAEGPLQKSCQKLRAALGISRRVGLAVCDRVATPLLVGIVRPLVLLPPAALSGWSAAELEMVLLHELAHVRRWDNLVNLLQRVVESLLFFHPAVWITSRWVRRDREDCCDAVVVAHTAKPQAYAELLLSLASPPPPLAGLALARHPLAGRIRRILRLEDEPMLISRKTMAVVGTLLLSLVLAASCYSPREIEADEATTNGANRANDVIATVDTEGSEELGEEQLKALLEVEEDHPAKKVRYKVREQYPDQIKDTFEGLAKDPYGPQIDVDWRWVITGEVIEINAPERAHEKFFEPVFAEWKEWVSSRPTKVENTTFRSPFPTLQEQLAADVAYKLLGVELEKLTDEEIERVKAMGHQGGLRVSAYGGGGFGRGSGGPLRNGDLLVGLHVWPTTSLDQVNHVLSRDDLDRLSPLKFYVIRRQEAPRQPPAEGYGEVEYGAAYGETATMVDQLVTGRIAVNLDAWRAVRQQRGIVAQDVDLIQTDEVIGKERTRSSMTRESLEKLHKQLAKDLQEKYDRYLTLSQELDSADTPNASAVLGVLANEVRLIQQQIIQKKEELLEIEVMKTLAIQQANSPSALDTAIQDELSADPMFQSFQQEQYAITQQLTQLIATTKGRGSPELSRLQQHLRNLEQQIQEYRLTKETEIRNRLNSAPNDMLAQVNSEYLLRRNSIVAELVELESQYEEKMEEVQRKGETSGTLAILKSEIEQLQEVAKTMELKLRSWEMKEIAGHNRVRVLQEAMLLYDGKTFDQWRELWKTELKTENRIECIKALAAFGRAGYGKQAVEAILEVARQYDYFRPGGSEQIQEFKNAAIQALAGSDGIPAEIWLPLLLARLEEEPRQWSDLTSLALAYVHGAEPDVIAILKAVSQGPGHTSEVRGAALAALVRHDEWTKDEEIVAMVHQALAGEESLVTSQVMGALRFKHLDLFPKQRDLLFHEDDTVHQTAVYSLRYLYDSTFASDILNSLLVVLDDPQLADDHLRVIQSFHALSFGGSWTNPVLAKRKPEVVARLEEILVEGDSSLLPWTIEALGLLTASDSAIVINRVRDSVTEQRGRELQTAAELAKGLRLQGGGGFIGSGGGGF